MLWSNFLNSTKILSIMIIHQSYNLISYLLSSPQSFTIRFLGRKTKRIIAYGCRRIRTKENWTPAYSLYSQAVSKICLETYLNFLIDISSSCYNKILTFQYGSSGYAMVKLFELDQNFIDKHNLSPLMKKRKRSNIKSNNYTMSE